LYCFIRQTWRFGFNQIAAAFPILYLPGIDGKVKSLASESFVINSLLPLFGPLPNEVNCITITVSRVKQ